MCVCTVRARERHREERPEEHVASIPDVMSLCFTVGGVRKYKRLSSIVISLTKKEVSTKLCKRLAQTFVMGGRDAGGMSYKSCPVSLDSVRLSREGVMLTQ